MVIRGRGDAAAKESAEKAESHSKLAADLLTDPKNQLSLKAAESTTAQDKSPSEPQINMTEKLPDGTAITRNKQGEVSQVDGDGSHGRHMKVEYERDGKTIKQVRVEGNKPGDGFTLKRDPSGDGTTYTYQGDGEQTKITGTHIKIDQNGVLSTADESGLHKYSPNGDALHIDRETGKRSYLDAQNQKVRFEKPEPPPAKPKGRYDIEPDSDILGVRG